MRTDFMKKTVSVILAVIMLLSSLAVGTVSASGESVSADAVPRSISYKLPGPKIKLVKSVPAGVKVGWNKMTGAVRTRVFRKTGNGSWTKLGDTTKNYFVDKTAALGKTYLYAVRTVSKDGKKFTSALSNAKGITFSYKGVKVMKVAANGLTKKIKVTVKITNKFAKQKLKYVKVKVGNKTCKFKLNKKGVAVRKIKVNKKGTYKVKVYGYANGRAVTKLITKKVKVK